MRGSSTWEAGGRPSDLEVVQRLDALDARLRIFLCTDGKTIGVSSDAEIKDGGTLGSSQGYGDTVAEALYAHYRVLTELPVGQYVIVGRGASRRTAVRWNGGAWKQVHE